MLSAVPVGEITFAIRLRHIHVSQTSVSDVMSMVVLRLQVTIHATLMSHLARQHRNVDIESPAVHSLVTSLPLDEDSTRMDHCGFENSSPDRSPCPDRSDH